MDPLRPRSLLGYAIVYFGLVVLIHFPGITDYFALPAGREDLIADMALGSPTLSIQILAYTLAVLFLNLLPLFVLLVSLRALAPTLRRHGLSLFPVFLLATLCLWCAALCFNKLYFPRSSFGLLLHIDDPDQMRGWGFGSLAIYLALGVIPALSVWTRTCAQACTHWLNKPVIAIALGTVFIASMVQPLQSRWLSPSGNTTQPNIIIIGLDSVTPLHLQHHPGRLPRLEQLLANATVFDNTITPLARTFPAWTSIITAQYPVHSGARFNLTDFDQVETRVTLPNILKAQGYTSVYAQDERKFNNLDEHFGFDYAVGPKIGAAEFVLTGISDHPLANLALLTTWGKKLFPFIALNRADHIHYDPDEFVTAVLDSLPQDLSKPLFLSTHFCLAHHPYTWRTQRRSQTNGKTNPVETQHINALVHLERQVDSLLQALQKSGRLDNAILVLLSDHGESLGYADGHWIALNKHHNPHDRYESDGYTPFPNGSGISGHGTDTLDRSQYQSLLAFQGFGPQHAKFAARTETRISSLVDIMPTLLGALGLDAPADIDGINLLAPALSDTRTVPAETGIRFSSLASIKNIDEEALLQESKKYYNVKADSARLIVKPELYAQLIKSKDIAMHTDDWILALLRKDRSPVFPRVAVLVHKPSGAWTTGNEKALIDRAPMAALTQGLQQLYGHELDDFETLWPFTHTPEDQWGKTRLIFP